MTVGLPGAGIGGMFYLIGALLAPVCEAVRAARGDASPRQWRLVIRQFLLACSILCGIGITGWVISIVLTSPAVTAELEHAAFDPQYPKAIGRHMALFTMGTLATVVIGVEMLRLIFATPGGPRNATARTPRLSARRMVAPGVVRTDDAA